MKYLAGLSDLKRFDPTSDASLIAPLLIPRVPGTANNTIVRKLIEDHMRKLDWAVELNSFTDLPPKAFSLKPVRFTNVIATIFPESPRKLVLAAHFDSLRIPDGFIGATDSAGPVAVMLDLANTLTPILRMNINTAHPPPISLQMIFFDGEEALVQWSGDDNTYGARHLAAKWKEESSISDADTIHPAKKRLEEIDLFVLLDLLGSSDPVPDIVSYFSDTAPVHSFAHKIEQRLASLNLMSSFNFNSGGYFTQSPFNGIVSDDHLPFLTEHVNILHVIPNPFPRCWHNEKGIPDDATCITPEVLDDFAKIFRVFVVEYLNADNRQLGR